MTRKRKLIIVSDDEFFDIQSMKKLASSDKTQLPMNNLFDLPNELKVSIFKHLDFNDLSNLAIVCKPFRDVIISHFLLNRECLETIFKHMSKTNSTDDYLKVSSDLGLLIKRSTFILPNFRRIKLIMKIFQIVDIRSRLRNAYEKDKATFKNFVKAIKCVLSKLIAGWVFKEILKLVDEIELYFNYSKMLMLIMTKEFGIIKNDEQFVRSFYRKILFECFDDNATRGKWLNYFLNYHTNFTSDEDQKTTFQSKLLLLMFAPVFQEENTDLIYIDWFCFSTTIFLKEGLEYLGFALKLLNSLNPQFRPNVLILFRAITNIGFFWLAENSSALLYHSGICIIKQIIDHLLKKDNFIQLIKYVVNMFIVESKQIAFTKIDPRDTIMDTVYEHLKSSLHGGNFESVLNLICNEFYSMARSIENPLDDREYCEASDIIGGLIQYYELRLKKRI